MTSIFGYDTISTTKILCRWDLVAIQQICLKEVNILKPQAKITVNYLLDLLKTEETAEESRSITDTIYSILDNEETDFLTYDETHEKGTSIING